MTKKQIKNLLKLLDQISSNTVLRENKSFDDKTAQHIENQARVDSLVQNAIHFYWHGGDIAKLEKEYFKGITLRGNLDAVERTFEEAVMLAPERIDLRFDEASTEILEGKMSEALCTYENILKMDPENFNASILFAIYSRLGGDSTAYQKMVSHLKKIYPDKVKKYIAAISKTDEILHTELSSIPQKLNLKNHAIVILGYALKDDGSMTLTLEERLRLGLELAKLNPESKMILCGGMAKSGIFESHIMKTWLIGNGVATGKIFLEDKSKDTVGNSVYSTLILKKLKIKNVTVITNASHMRRALSVFVEECTVENLNISFSNLVYLDYPSLENAQKITINEKLVIFRDLMRTCGIWAYPGIQQ